MSEPAVASDVLLAVEPEDVTAGGIGFLVIASLVVGTVFLLRSMNKQLKRVDFDEDEDEDGDGDGEAADSDGEAAEDSGADADAGRERAGDFGDTGDTGRERVEDSGADSGDTAPELDEGRPADRPSREG